MENLKYNTNEPIYETQTDDGHGEQTCGCQGGGGGNVMDRAFGVARHQLVHLEWISNEILLHSTENYIQLLVMEHDGG